MHAPLHQLRADLDQKKYSARELAQAYAQRIRETQDTLNSFITVLSDEEIQKRAAYADELMSLGKTTLLTGIPYAAKDIFLTQGIRTTAASQILKDYVATYDGTAIEKCADAVLLGKTSLDEFAMGSSNEYSSFGPVKNPYALEYVPGGSSGGSAVSVAAGQAAFAFGTDTGGSIRLPAGFTATVGFKPTYGRISRYGVIAMTSSLDTVGYLTQDVRDAALLLESLAGQDERDSTSSTTPVEKYSEGIEESISGMRIGMPKEYFEIDGLQEPVRRSIEAVRKTLESLGATVVEVSLPHTAYAMAAYYILSPSEVSSNLSKFDGIRFGKRPAGAENLEEIYLQMREGGFSAEVKRRIMLGTFCLSAGNLDAYYMKALKVRRLATQDFHTAFQKVDVILAPTTPTLPFPLGERMTDPISMYLADSLTIPTSLAGVPSISIPVASENNLPIGAQCIGRLHDERTVLRVARAIERELQWTRPTLAL